MYLDNLIQREPEREECYNKFFRNVFSIFYIISRLQLYIYLYFFSITKILYFVLKFFCAIELLCYI